MEPVTYGRSSASTALPRAPWAGAQAVGQRSHFGAGAQRTGTDQDRHLLASVEHGHAVDVASVGVGCGGA
jgi:hypothetical protein